MTNSIEGIASIKKNYPPTRGFAMPGSVGVKSAFMELAEEEHAHHMNNEKPDSNEKRPYYTNQTSYGSERVAARTGSNEEWHHDEFLDNSWMIEDGERDGKVFQVLLLIVLVAIVGVGCLSILLGILSVWYRDDEAFYLPTSCSVMERYGCSCENEDSNRYLSSARQLFDFEKHGDNSISNTISTNEDPILYPCSTQRKCVFKTLVHSDNSTRRTCLLFPESNYPIGSNTTCYLSKNHSDLVSFTFYSSVNEAMKMVGVLFGIFASALLVVTVFFSILVASFKLCQRRKLALMRNSNVATNSL